MTAQWFDHYVEASARSEMERDERRRRGPFARGPNSVNPVPEWGTNPAFGDDDDDDEGITVDPPWTPPT